MPATNELSQLLKEVFTKANEYIKQTQSAIEGYERKYLEQVANYNYIKEKVGEAKNKVEGFLAAYPDRSLILLGIKEINAKRREIAKVEKKKERERKAVEQKHQNQQEKNEAKLLLGLATANICASCHLTPDADGEWKGCDEHECKKWFCDLCWDLESESDSMCIYCVLGI